MDEPITCVSCDAVIDRIITDPDPPIVASDHLTVVARYICPACGSHCQELVDVAYSPSATVH